MQRCSIFWSFKNGVRFRLREVNVRLQEVINAGDRGLESAYETCPRAEGVRKRRFDCIFHFSAVWTEEWFKCAPVPVQDKTNKQTKNLGRSIAGKN